jgi:hypothetical protein
MDSHLCLNITRHALVPARRAARIRAPAGCYCEPTLLALSNAPKRVQVGREGRPFGCTRASAQKPLDRFARDLGRDRVAAGEFPVAHLVTSAVEFGDDPPAGLLVWQDTVLGSV